MKKLERLFRKIGNADVHVWGYSTLGILPKNLFVIRQNYNFNGSKYDKKARKIIFHAFLLYDTYYINRKRILFRGWI